MQSLGVERSVTATACRRVAAIEFWPAFQGRVRDRTSKRRRVSDAWKSPVSSVADATRIWWCNHSRPWKAGL